MICCDKKRPGGDSSTNRRGDIIDSYFLATAAVGCYVSMWFNIPSQSKKPPKEIRQWSFYMRTFTHLSTSKPILKTFHKNLHSYTSVALKAVQAKIKIK